MRTKPRRRVLTWWLAATVLLVGLVLFVAQINRDSIARRVANSYLDQQGIRVDTVSIDAVHTDRVQFSSILLELDNGTVILITDVSLPFDRSSETADVLRIGGVEITPAASTSERGAIARFYPALLALPSTVPARRIHIGKLEYANAPVLEDIDWASNGSDQSIAFGLLGLRVQVSVVRDDGLPLVELSARDPAHDLALNCELVANQVSVDVDLSGDCEFHMAMLLPALQEIGAIPTIFTDLSAAFRGPTSLRLLAEGPDDIQFAVMPTLDDELGVTYASGMPEQWQVVARHMDESRFQFGYPSLAWQINVARGDIFVSNDVVENLPVGITDLKCENGIHCTLNMLLDDVDIDVQGWELTSITGSAPLEADVSAVAMMITARETSLSAHLTPGDPLPLYESLLSNLIFDLGSFEMNDEGIIAAISAHTIGGSEFAALHVKREAATGAGTVSVSGADIDFRYTPMSGFLAKWPFEWDVVAGKSSFSANVNWEPGTTDFTYEGGADIAFDDLSGRYFDSAFTGLTTNINMKLDDQQGIRLSPAIISAQLLDIGIPIEDISVELSMDPTAKTVLINDLSMSALDGRLIAEPFVYSMETHSADVQLQPESVQLQFIVALAKFESIEMTGSVSGFLPVQINDKNVVISGGKLESDEPGGVIRYHPAGVEEAQDMDSQLDIVTSALSNFQYESLVSDVDYDESGDLVLQMTIRGRNPDLDPLQPVILNLSVENNVPDLLRSLQATRTIEDILERSANK